MAKGMMLVMESKNVLILDPPEEINGYDNLIFASNCAFVDIQTEHGTFSKLCKFCLN